MAERGTRHDPRRVEPNEQPFGVDAEEAALDAEAPNKISGMRHLRLGWWAEDFQDFSSGLAGKDVVHEVAQHLLAWRWPVDSGPARLVLPRGAIELLLVRGRRETMTTGLYEHQGYGHDHCVNAKTEHGRLTDMEFSGGRDGRKPALTSAETTC